MLKTIGCFIMAFILALIFSTCGIKNKDDFDKSIKTYEQELAINPNDIIALRNLAIIYLIKEENNKALIMITKAYKLAPDDLATLKTFIQVNIQLGNMEDANYAMKKMEIVLKKSKETSSVKALYYYYLATWYKSEKKYSKAIENIDMALKLQPDNKIWFDKNSFKESDAAHKLYINFKEEILKAKELGSNSN